MADKKVSDLPSLNGADVDAADLLYIVDSSAGAAGSKKITVGQYQLAPVSGGTANTVVYLNGSKVESSSSALTFDGTNLGIGTSSPGAKLEVASGKVLLSNTQSYAIKTSAGASCDVVTLTSGNVLQLGGGGATDSIQFWNQGAQRMTLDSSGNLGLGVTPSAWGSNYKAFESAGNSSVAIAAANINGINIASNTYNDNTNWIYKTTGAAARYSVNTGVHQWYTAPSGTAGNAISFTQAMTLDASGNLLVVATSAELGAGFGNILIQGSSGAIVQAQTGAGTVKCAISTDSSNGYVGTRTNHPVLFNTNNSERARITSGGNLLVGKTTEFGQAFRLVVEANSSTTAVPGVFADPRTDAASAITVAFYRNGTKVGSIDTTNAATSYVTSSDRRLKENIAPAADAGAVIDAIEVVQHDWKVGGHTRYGVIAQDLHTVAPEAVSEGDSGADIEKVWGVDYSKLVPMLIKEIQSLRARVAALEAK